MENQRQSTIVLPVSTTLLLPGTDVSISLDEAQRRQIEQSQKQVFLALMVKEKSSGKKDLQLSDFYQKGAAFTSTSIVSNEQGMAVMAHIVSRVSVAEVHQSGDIFYAEYEEVPEQEDLDEAMEEEILGYIKKAVHEVVDGFPWGEQFSKNVDAYRDINVLMVYLAQFIPLSAEERYRLLETDSRKERAILFIDYQLRHRELMKLNIEMHEKFSENASQYYRKQALREQLRAIQAELDEGEGKKSGKKDYRARIEEADLPEEIREAALEEVQKLDGLGQEGSEQSQIRNYLEFLLALPWKLETSKPIDIGQARKILDERHYGLQKVKDRIIQHLAVMHLKNDQKGSILLLVGPPGTGKTSLGKSIADALGRKYCRMSLGGIRDESEIRGHRRTYVGAMPGRILKSMKQAQATDPVIVLDEIDKLMNGGFSGDPASALLEVLDPEQNHTFTDHYLDLPYDLSKVFFIATANSLDTIPGPLLDRMEVIEISGYTPDEKFHIGRDHLIPEVLKDHGMTSEQLVFSDEVLRTVIADYTQEAGVRGLKKQLSSLARATSEKIVTGNVVLPYRVGEHELDDILGRKVSHHEKAGVSNPPGVVTGLAWTPVGGEILFIESTVMPGSGEVILTGQLGDVMQESARISLSLLKSRLPVDMVPFKNCDLHIHVPSGATPKDGPSAGIALFTALASLVTGKKVSSTLAMTGELTLRGQVMPIGGLKEKLFGAHRAGIRTVLIPAENEADLRDVPKEIKEQLTIIPVNCVEDVLRETLEMDLPRIEHTLYPLHLEQKLIQPS